MDTAVYHTTLLVFLCLRERLLHQTSVDIRQTEVPALEKKREFGMVDTETVQDRRLQVMNVDRIGHDVVAEIVRFADHRAGLYAPARHPHRETPRMMVAA